MSNQRDRMHGLIERMAARFEAEHPGLLPYSAVDLARNVHFPWFAVRSRSLARAKDLEYPLEGAPTPVAEEPAADPEVATVYLFDEIGGSMGVQADELARQIDMITEPTIHVRINSPGGAVWDGITIYNALNHSPARVKSFVDGIAASAATIVAFAGDEIVVMPGGQMMFHDASSPGDGNPSDHQYLADFLTRQSQNVAEIYALRTAARGIDAAQWRAWMTEETWMLGQEAVDFGAADRYETSAAPVSPITEPIIAERMARQHDLSRFHYRGRRNPPRRSSGLDDARPQGGARVAGRSEELSGIERDIATGRAVPSAPDLSAAAAARGEGAERRAHALAQEGRSVPVLRTSDRFQTSLRTVRAEMPGDVGAARLQGFSSKLQRAGEISKNGKTLAHIAGYASMYGHKHKYEMWDAFGPYWEFVRERAGAKSLARGPDVAFLVNHMGVTMARTRAGTLELADDDLGLADDAYVNPDRVDVQTLLTAIDDGDISEQSFAFMVDEGLWSEDFSAFQIVEYDIDRGDVSAVNYGANPFTSISARGQQIMADLDRMPVGLAEAALTRLARRTDVTSRLARLELVKPAETPPERTSAAPSDDQALATGRRVTHIEALLGD